MCVEDFFGELVAVDIGNSRIKLGWFERVDGSDLPMPTRMTQLAPSDWNEEQIADWLGSISVSADAATWVIASVNPPAVAQLADWLTARGVTSHQLTVADIPITIDLPEPQRVGVDRLVGAAAANRLRDSARPAIVVDLGSAITIDLVTATGTFAGGAILPGIGMAARALHEQTEQLPHHPREELASEPHVLGPPALGKSTDEAIDSGLFWGAVGAIRELIARLTKEQSADQSAKPQVFLTGGAAPAVAGLLGPDVRHVPHLLLGGIVISHEHSTDKT